MTMTSALYGTGRCALALVVFSLGGLGVDGFFVGSASWKVLPQGISSRSSLDRSSSRCQKQQQQRQQRQQGSGRRSSASVTRMATTVEIAPFPYEDVLPFLKEHVQPSDQMLVMGCATDLPLQLSRDGYGTRDKRSFMRCIDSDPDVISVIKAAAEADPVCSKHMANGNLIFEALDVTGGMPELKQSSADCIVDAGLLDKLVTTQGVDAAKACSDAAHRAVRLGNPLVALSMINKDEFAQIFDGNWGWMQELDGDPGAVSQWYRDKKVNIKDVGNNFVELGISFFVYTNVDNC
ncbi:unnamed protein product [Pylaiella littoralis]